MRDALLGLGMLALFVPILVWVLAPARQVWRGDTAQLPRLPEVPVSGRSYLAFLMWFVPVFGGLALMGLALVAAASAELKVALQPVAVASIGLVLAGAPLIVVHVVVHAFGWPTVLVPPPYRGQPGAVAQALERRRRRRSGRPETDHPVEIVEISLEPPDPRYPPFLTGICREPECAWTADVDVKLVGVPAEEQLRAKAAEHTTMVTAEVRRQTSSQG